MVNEAHNGMTRWVRTREVGGRMIRAAHGIGLRRLAMEALPRLPILPLGPVNEFPAADCGYLAHRPGEPLLVWCGNGHATKTAPGEWAPNGPALRGYVRRRLLRHRPDRHRGLPRRRPILGAWAARQHREHAGRTWRHRRILSSQVPPPLCGWPGVDALVVSTDNAMT